MDLVTVLLSVSIFCGLTLPATKALPLAATSRAFTDFCTRPKPWSLADIHPDLHAYARGKDDHATIKNDIDLQNFISKIDQNKILDSNRPVIFIVHGYFGYMWWTYWIDQLKDALLKIEDSTVIVLKWSKGADDIFYGQSASNTQTMATLLANFSTGILNSTAFKSDSTKLYLHCIGHSLGAQICGQAGRLSGLFDRATGLDPAGPGFEKCGDRLHIDTDSATCVDNIHTDGTHDGHFWNPVTEHYGTLMPWGHVSFYPNDGRKQPACWPGPCSHTIVVDYFVETVTNGPDRCAAKGTCDPALMSSGGVAENCTDNIIQSMGYFSSCHRQSSGIVPGVFHLPISKSNPYC